MSEELEQSVPDVTGESSAPAESASLEKGPEVNSELSSSSENKPIEQEKYVPYDRFKELVEQKNEFSRRQEAAERQLKEFQDKFEKLSSSPKPASEEAKLIERLKGIDPEFGKLIEKQRAEAAELQEMRQWRQQYEAQSQQAQAQATLEKLQGELKVSPYLHQRYVDSIRVAAQSNPNLKMTDLPALYKQHHTEMGKFLEEQKRAALAEYSASKKSDASVTSSPKGTPSKAAPAKAASPKKSDVDPLDELKASLRQEFKKSRIL